MIIRRIYDPELIREVARLDWDNIAADNQSNFDEFLPDVNADRFFGGFVAGEIVGIVMLKDKDEHTAAHIITVPEKKAYAYILAKRALNHAKMPVQTEIPDNYLNVIKFAEYLGFKEIGRRKEGWVKNGIAGDLIIMRLR